MENDYLVKKKPILALFIFALPMIIGNFFQQMYTMTDSAVVGRYVGEEALAAVGVSYSLTTVFICIAIGGGIGASVIVSRYFGAKMYKRMKTAVFMAFIAFLAVSIFLGVFGLVFSKKIIILLNTPSNVIDMAVEYLNIYFLGLPFLFMYNVVSSMFNALGKSKIPLYFLIFSSVLNIILDILLVTCFNMGVVGVAWATFIAQGISVVLSFFVFMIQLRKLKIGKTTLFDMTELVTMAKIAFPSILQQSTVSIGLMLVQSSVNNFGSEVLAGFSAAMRIESVCVVPMAAIGNALSSYTAQNIGAGKMERVPQGYKCANIMVIISGIVILAVIELFNGQIMSLFMGGDATKEAFDTGYNLMAYMGFFYSMIGFKMAVDGLLRGAGDMVMFTVANLANLFIRVFVAVVFSPKFGVEVIWYVVPLGWFVNWLVSFYQYKAGKWKRIYQSAN